MFSPTERTHSRKTTRIDARLCPATLQEDRKLDVLDEDSAEFAERVEVPDLEALSERLHSCLQESEELHSDFTQLFDGTLFKVDTHLIPEAILCYKVRPRVLS